MTPDDVLAVIAALSEKGIPPTLPRIAEKAGASEPEVQPLLDELEHGKRVYIMRTSANWVADRMTEPNWRISYHIWGSERS